MSECDCAQCRGLAVHYTEVGGVCENTRSLGQQQITLDALWRRVVEMEKRIRALEQRPRTMTGTIQGLEGEFTVTPPPEFEA